MKQFNATAVMPFAFPHFIGTFDSFINQYVFLPFGHLVMECGKRPRLIGQPINEWDPSETHPWKNLECNQKACKLNNYSYSISDELIPVHSKTHFKSCTQSHKYCKELKKTIVTSGLATQTDANYFAYKILHTYPNVSKALIKRFPMLLVDEAQDCSEMQMKIIDILVDNGLREVMLVGDTDQSIYEWRKAEPTLFQKKIEDWEKIELNDNWRSSQHICNWSHKLSSLPVCSNAKNANICKFSVAPQIWPRGINSEKLIAQFIVFCEEHGIYPSKNRISILARSNSTIDNLLGNHQNYTHPPWNHQITKYVALSKWCFDNNRYKDALKHLEHAIALHLTKQPFVSFDDIRKQVEGHGFHKWRSTMYIILKDMPTFSGKLQQWVMAANAVLASHALCTGLNLKIKKRTIYEKMDTKELFADELTIKNNIYYGTVHSVKGQTLDAVMLFLNEKDGNTKYESILTKPPIESENKRIIYVAMTRPKQILVLAVPDNKITLWKDYFETIRQPESN